MVVTVRRTRVFPPATQFTRVTVPLRSFARPDADCAGSTHRPQTRQSDGGLEALEAGGRGNLVLTFGFPGNLVHFFANAGNLTPLCAKPGNLVHFCAFDQVICGPNPVIYAKGCRLGASVRCKMCSAAYLLASPRRVCTLLPRFVAGVSE